MNGNRMLLIYSFIFINTESEHIDDVTSIASVFKYDFIHHYWDVSVIKYNNYNYDEYVN